MKTKILILHFLSLGLDWTEEAEDEESIRFYHFQKKIYFIDVKVKSIVKRSVLKLNFAYHTDF